MQPQTTTPRRLCSLCKWRILSPSEGREGVCLDQVLSNHCGIWRTALPEVPGSRPRWLIRASVLVARLLVAKMAAEHPEPPKGELQLPPPPPPGHYGAWAAQELQAKLAEIGAPIQGEARGPVKGGCVGLWRSGAWLPRRPTGRGRRQAAGARPGQGVSSGWC